MKVNICGQVHFLSSLNMQICDLFVIVAVVASLAPW